VTGIAFNLILIRVAQRRAEEGSRAADSGPTSGLQFNITQSKPPVGQFDVEAIGEIRFRARPDDLHSMTQSDTASVV
jgi:hypothetical protein